MNDADAALTAGAEGGTLRTRSFTLRLGHGETLVVVAHVHRGDGPVRADELQNAVQRTIWETVDANGDRVQVLVAVVRDGGSGVVVVPVKPE